MQIDPILVVKTDADSAGHSLCLLIKTDKEGYSVRCVNPEENCYILSSCSELQVMLGALRVLLNCVGAPAARSSSAHPGPSQTSGSRDLAINSRAARQTGGKGESGACGLPATKFLQGWYTRNFPESCKRREGSQQSC